jgi:hypothetical protein
MHAALLYLLLAVPPVAPDTLVVCPADFRPALARWDEYRRSQGHAILVVEPPPSATELKALVRRVAQAGRLKYIVLVGDVPGLQSGASNARRVTVPTNYIPAKINTRWGSEPTIATDVPYADLDDDGLPDVAVGRIAADTEQELAAFVGKVIRYERSESGDWQRRLNIVVGVGGLGAVTDAVVEAAGRYVVQQTVPGDYVVDHMRVQTRGRPAAEEFRSQLHKQLRNGSLAWVYLGHALPTELDRIPCAGGEQPLLSVNDVPQLRCGDCSPLAVLVACYTGAIDAGRDCLAEELSLAAEGPVAVIAATRVTMPYGNTVLGYELLRACFQDGRPTIGDILLLAQQRTRREAAGDPLRESLDAMCQGLSPPPVNLAAERAEHAAMYHLFGDPLLRLRRWEPRIARPAAIQPGAK